MTAQAPGRVVAFVDIGTNSVRLLIVRILPNESLTVLSDQKEVVRLGEKEFASGELQPAAMERLLRVCRHLVEVARHYGAEETVAVATSAMREARNQAVLVRRLSREVDLDVRVISGVEEARLIYLGVASGLHLGKRLALFIDIGGGSTELAVGDQNAHRYLESLPLGAIRLTTLFLPDETGPISAEGYAQLQWHVRNAAVYATQQVNSLHPALTVGSSGTVENLAQVASRYIGKDTAPETSLRLDHLKKVMRMLCALPLERRRGVPGINPERADIIIAGGAILETLMEEMHLRSVQVSRRGLRDGLLVDYLARTERTPWMAQVSVRMRSVLQLGRACNFDEAHSRKVANLTLQLFDSARRSGLHRLGDAERELLEYTALLHDVGAFLSYHNQHAHTYYLIRNYDLLGFDEREVAIMATSALYHRRTLPRKTHPEFAVLDKSAQHTVEILSLFLRLAESLDRGHTGVVRAAELHKEGDSVLLALQCERECDLQVWGVKTHEKAVQKVLHRALATKVTVGPAQPTRKRRGSRRTQGQGES